MTPSLRGNRWAFIGLGEMGKRMATNLARTLSEHACPPLLVWNRTPNGVEAFKAWAAERKVPEETYIVMSDLKEIVKEYYLVRRALMAEPTSS